MYLSVSTHKEYVLNTSSSVLNINNIHTALYIPCTLVFSLIRFYTRILQFAYMFFFSFVLTLCSFNTTYTLFVQLLFHVSKFICPDSTIDAVFLHLQFICLIEFHTQCLYCLYVSRFNLITLRKAKIVYNMAFLGAIGLIVNPLNTIHTVFIYLLFIMPYF